MAVEAEPPKVTLRGYREAMEKLHGKGFNYREIAEWMTEFLGVPVNRNQVVYVLNMHDAIQHQDEIEEHNEELADEADARGLYTLASEQPSSSLPKKSRRLKKAKP